MLIAPAIQKPQAGRITEVHKFEVKLGNNKTQLKNVYCRRFKNKGKQETISLKNNMHKGWFKW
jgi:hypothetical protein